MGGMLFFKKSKSNYDMRYDILNGFKCRVNRHVLSLGSF